MAPSPEDTIALLKATLDATHDAILVVDNDRRVVLCNRQYLRMFGFTEEALAEGGVDYILRALMPELENAEELTVTSKAIWADPEIEILDLLRFKDGRVLERYLAPHRIGGRTVGRVVCFRDVTTAVETARALEQHRALLEKAQEVAQLGSWVAELASGRLEWSTEAHRIFGVAPSDFNGFSDSFFSRVHEDDRAAVRDAIDAALAGERPYDVEHRIVREDGSTRWVHEKADIVRDTNGRALRMIGTVQDVTERRQLEDQLRQSQKMEAIGRLAGGIAHDLNNALTAIAGYAELALGELSANESARADVEEIRRAAERAGSVTRQLLAFSRKQLLEPRLFNLNDTIIALGRLLSRLLGADIVVRTELSTSVPPILGDPGQVEQAVINLAVNARDAMPGGGRLVLATSVEQVGDAEARVNAPMAAGTYVVLRVTDTGHGMTPETKARIFEPFFTTKEIGRGTGLGLSMVYGTLKQIGGFIFVDSAPGRGTTFRLYFRPAPVTEDDGAPHVALPAEPAPAHETILVVEDEPSVRSLVASALQHDGYNLLLAASAEEALDVAAAHPERIDLLLTDAIMPGKSGIELAQALTAERRGLRVIVMSGYTHETLRGLDSRVELIQKPFAPRDLRRRIREALDQARESSR